MLKRDLLQIQKHKESKMKRMEKTYFMQMEIKKH